MKKSVIEIVNEKIIEKLESGINPWIKPWNYPNAKGDSKVLAMNYITNKPYNGINQILLDAGYYLTFNQIKELGGHLKKDSKGQMVIYSAPTIYKTKETNPTTLEVEEIEKKSFLLKYYYVFNLNDVENYHQIKGRNEKHFEEYETKTNEEIDVLINDYTNRSLVKLTTKLTNDAYYSQITHSVVVPKASQYNNIEEYYSTLFHELGHSTGHESLLNRDTLKGVSFWGDNTYAKEELVAEITSAYCLNYCGIDTNKTLTNNVAYLQSWADQLKNNTRNYFILNAMTKATDAFNLIMNIKEEKEMRE